MNRRNLLKWFSFAPFAGLASAVKAVENPTEIVKLVFETKTCYYTKINGIHVLHRLDGPAIEFSSGCKYWYRNDLLHRMDGPAVEYADGSKKWIFNGRYHREDGPAVELDKFCKAWYFNGKLHRINGPAVEWANGNKEWWIDGRKWKEEFIDGVTKVNLGE